MDVGQFGDIAHAEALEQLCSGVEVGRVLVERPEEELVELTFEERSVDERAAEHESHPTDLLRPGDPTESGAQRWQPSRRDERLEPPTRIRWLCVDPTHRSQTCVADHGVTGDQATAVVADDGDRVESEEADDTPHTGDVLSDRHRRVAVESAGAH